MRNAIASIRGESARKSSGDIHRISFRLDSSESCPDRSLVGLPGVWVVAQDHRQPLVVTSHCVPFCQLEKEGNMRTMNKSELLLAVGFCTASVCFGCAAGTETEPAWEPESESTPADTAPPTEAPAPEPSPPIQLFQVDGRDSDELIAKCQGFLCLIGQRADKDAHFVLPPGYKRDNFSFSVDPRVSAGGSAEWANDDPHDATIHLHAWADAVSKCIVKVYAVSAVKE